MVSVYRVYWESESEDRYDDYIQALSAQQAADFAREYIGAANVIEVSKVVKNWK